MTTPQLRLITEVSAVLPGMPSRGRPPNIGVVYATNAGELGSYPDWRPMTFREQLRTRYRRRYDVDMSHHRRRAYMMSTPLPARGDFYRFIADVEVGFRVHDPEEIVRRNLANPLQQVVYAHLTDEFRKITRKYDIEDSELAESEIVSRFDGDDVLPDGITVFYVAPRLLPDKEATRYLQDRKDAERRVHLTRDEHKVELLAAQQRGELHRMNREFERDMADLEFQRMDGRVLDAYEIVRHHLARHPDDTPGALDLIIKHRKAWMEHQEKYNKRTAELFNSMVHNNLVQAADMEKLLPEMLQHLLLVPAPVPVESDLGDEWKEPPVLPKDAPEVVDVQPVYLVLDESVEAEALLPCLNNELPQMLARIAGNPAAAGIRLAVLGFARHLTPHLSLDIASTTREMPALAVGGEAAYAVLFGSLARRIDEDMDKVPPGQDLKDPLVYVLCASSAEDNWTADRHRLTDPEARTRVPEIVAFGVGGATRDLVRAIATEPGNAYFVSADEDPIIAVRHFCDFTVRDLLDRVREPGARKAVAPPEGFTPAGVEAT
ncbi:hypothetical protein HH310_06755 [Actinoplanes sp. TBRC 11911]|uniref:hypothetical protein n=1 Tax=Actinoplanes sp. TBRC 11911 TaxID=2729386 RepID=UPI00145D400B|nr:hypothetical protein [Actinoplanes sp. TBRC 11911]NMO50893.1 hypothetical protein [Actinoplanes sp. TBRC 11911]